MKWRGTKVGGRLLAALALCALALLLAGTAAAQCPLCRTGLQQAGDQTARTMNLAIVVLLIPPVSIFCAIFAVAYRRRGGGGEGEQGRGGQDPGGQNRVR